MAYGGFKLQSLLSYTDYSIFELNAYDQFGPEEAFGHEDHFAVSAAFIAWD